jgi:catechol 2,3-dioxygenase-like lactoylglutathione lyase family enzyme
MSRISEVALFTADVSRLADFYERLLGRPADSRSDAHASFDLEGTVLLIRVAGDGVEGAPNEDHIALALDQDAAATGTRRRRRSGRTAGVLLGTLGVRARPGRPRARASARELTQALAHARVVGDHALEVGARNRQAAHVGERAHASGAFSFAAEQ